MARKLFISFLGTNFYEKCTYYDQKCDYQPTRFIQRATLEKIGSDTWTADDAVLIFVTEKASLSNWDERLNTRENRDKKEVPYIRLEHELKDMHLKANIKSVPVVDGKDEDEMWQIFQTVYDEINENDELYIDLTHAFRYLPMLVLVLSNYAKFLKHIEVKQLSYGNWEARDAKTNRAPIIDLMSLSMLQDWTTAASEFLQHGYAGRLKEAIKDKLLPLLKDADKRTENVVNVNKFGANLENFVEDRLTCRGMNIANGTTALNLRQQLDKIEDTGITVLNPIFHRLKEVTTIPSDIPSRCYDAAEWCYKRQLYQQAITILQEGLNTFFSLRNGIDIDDEARRDYVGKAFKLKSDELSPGGKKTKDVNIIDNVHLQSLLNDELLNNKDIVNHYTDLSGTRNDFNHAGFRSVRKPLNPYQIKQKIKSNLDFFQNILTEAASTSKPLAKVFLNISNHPSVSWNEEQLKAAETYGEVRDYPFPKIPSEATTEEIKALAEKTQHDILNTYASFDITAHVMGEMTFTYHLVSLLKGRSIRCVASCTEREVEDLGKGRRVTQFNFSQFREY